MVTENFCQSNLKIVLALFSFLGQAVVAGEKIMFILKTADGRSWGKSRGDHGYGLGHNHNVAKFKTKRAAEQVAKRIAKRTRAEVQVVEQTVR